MLGCVAAALLAVTYPYRVIIATKCNAKLSVTGELAMIKVWLLTSDASLLMELEIGGTGGSSTVTMKLRECSGYNS
eukprot:scaffold37723_cov189-Skeletonema_marinoi.AAC.3